MGVNTSFVILHAWFQSYWR